MFPSFTCTFQSTLERLNTISDLAVYQRPMAPRPHRTTSLMITQLPPRPYSTQRGGEICQNGSVFISAALTARCLTTNGGSVKLGDLAN